MADTDITKGGGAPAARRPTDIFSQMRDEMDRVLRGEKLEPLNRGDSAGPSADAPVTSAPAESAASSSSA